jgi:hypothetical protein
MPSLAINSLKPSVDVLLELERLVKEKGLDYIDAALLYAEMHGIEIETLGSVIKSSAIIKSRIQADAERLHFLPKTASLPL